MEGRVHVFPGHDAYLGARLGPRPFVPQAVSRRQMVWMTVLSVAVFALAFAAQGKVKAVLDWLPLSSIRALERSGDGDVRALRMEHEFARRRQNVSANFVGSILRRRRMV